MARAPIAPPTPVSYKLLEDGAVTTRVLEGEEARQWHGLRTLCDESPSIYTILADIVRNGLTYLDDRFVQWGRQTGYLIRNEQEGPPYSASTLVRHFILAIP